MHNFSSLLFSDAFVEKKKANAAMLIDVRRGIKEKLSRFARKIWRAEKELPFCGLVGGGPRIRAGSADLPGPTICQRSVCFVD